MQKEIKHEAPAEAWIYGINPVVEALRAGRNVRRLVVSAGRHEKLRELRAEAEKRGIAVQFEDNRFFESHFPKGHQGVAARVSKKECVDIDELIAIPEQKGENALFIIVDCIDDPRNLGAILRSVDAAGGHGVVIQSYRSAGLGSDASKASAGAVEYVPVSVVPNIKHALRKLKERGVTVVGAEAGGAVSLWEADLTMPLGLVVGSEGKGLRRTVREQCDVIVSIPTKGRVNSLNVSVATGIVLFEILRQRSTI